MKYIDALKLDDEHFFETDICIVGAGISGITLAKKLSELGNDVTLVEAGGERGHSGYQDIFKGEIENYHTDSPLTQFRSSQLGGTSGFWGGRCIPFDEMDFKKRSYIKNSGWPIGLVDIEPFYPEALELCEAGAFEFSPRAPKLFGPDFPYDSQELDSALKQLTERWSPPTNFWKKYHESLKKHANLTVIYNAVCSELTLTDNLQKITSSKFLTTQDTKLWIRSNNYILAAGGVENVRILLNNNSQLPNGIGNKNDNVGRYYMSHLNGVIGEFTLSSPEHSKTNTYYRDECGVFVRNYIGICSGKLIEQKIPNISLRPHFHAVGDPIHGSSILSAIYYAKNVRAIARRVPMNLDPIGGLSKDALMKLHFGHFRNLLQDFPGLASFVPSFLLNNVLGTRRIPSILQQPKDGSFPMLYQSEQTPLPTSRIYLGKRKDQFGHRRIKIHYDVADSDFEAIIRAHQLFKQQVEDSKVGKFEFIDLELVKEMRRQMQPVQGHFIGGTRMSTQPQKGVTDLNCKVFSVENLFIAGSSVFPTNAAANPTLTIIALALRLAAHLNSDR